MQAQDVADKGGIGLVGLKTNSEIIGQASTLVKSGKQKVEEPRVGLSIDKNCISCSGNQPAVLSCFRIACLQFQNGTIALNN